MTPTTTAEHFLGTEDRSRVNSALDLDVCNDRNPRHVRQRQGNDNFGLDRCDARGKWDPAVAGSAKNGPSFRPATGRRRWPVAATARPPASGGGQGTRSSTYFLAEGIWAGSADGNKERPSGQCVRVGRRHARPGDAGSLVGLMRHRRRADHRARMFVGRFLLACINSQREAPGPAPGERIRKVSPCFFSMGRIFRLGECLGTREQISLGKVLRVSGGVRGRASLLHRFSRNRAFPC